MERADQVAVAAAVCLAISAALTLAEFYNLRHTMAAPQHHRHHVVIPSLLLALLVLDAGAFIVARAAHGVAARALRSAMETRLVQGTGGWDTRRAIRYTRRYYRRS